jgi:hypothetical protein
MPASRAAPHRTTSVPRGVLCPQAYDVKRQSHVDEEGVLHDVVNGLENEIPTRRIARRGNALVKSDETKSALEALEIARREAPGIGR